MTNWAPLCPNRKNTTLPDSSFNIIQEGSCLGIKRTRRIQCPRDCSGNYTDWIENVNNPVCPSKTDYSILDTNFNIRRNRTRTFDIKTKALNEGTCPEANTSNTNQTYDFTCPRDCSGNWTVSDCTAVCPGNGLDNNGTSTVNRNNDPAKQKKVFNLFKANLGTGEACPAERLIFESCSIPCTLDCTGKWGTPFGCTAKCAPSNSNEATTEKTGEQFKDWINAKGPFNGGRTCPTRTKEICSVSNCPVDCIGDWNETTACSAPCPGNASADNGGISSGVIQNIFRIRRNKNIIGASCTNTEGQQRESATCTRVCPINCTGGNYGAYHCRDCCPSAETYYGRKLQVGCDQYRYWENNKGPLHGGQGCPGAEKTSCLRDCVGQSKSNFNIFTEATPSNFNIFGVDTGNIRKCFNAHGGRNWNRQTILYGRDCIRFTIDHSGIIKDHDNPKYFLGYGPNYNYLEYTDGTNNTKPLICHMPKNSNNLGNIWCRTSDNLHSGWIYNDSGGRLILHHSLKTSFKLE